MKTSSATRRSRSRSCASGASPNKLRLARAREWLRSGAAKLQPDCRSSRTDAVTTACGSRLFHREIGRSGVVRGRERNFSFGGPKQKLFPRSEHEGQLDSRRFPSFTGGCAPQNLGSHYSRSPDLPVKSWGFERSCGHSVVAKSFGPFAPRHSGASAAIIDRLGLCPASRVA